MEDCIDQLLYDEPILHLQYERSLVPLHCSLDGSLHSASSIFWVLLLCLWWTLHMDITRRPTLKSDWFYSLQPKMENLYTVSKNKTRNWLWLRSWAPYCQIQTSLRPRSRAEARRTPCLRGGGQEELPHVWDQGQWPRMSGCDWLRGATSLCLSQYNSVSCLRTCFSLTGTFWLILSF